MWANEWLDIGSGSALCYPPGVVRKVHNDSDAPLTYVCFSVRVNGATSKQ